MIVSEQYKNQTVVVFGLGKTGVITVKSLSKGGANVLAWDDNIKARRLAKKERISLKNIYFIDWSRVKCLVLSPGVPLNFPKPHPVVLLAKKNQCQIIGDFELFQHQISRKKHLNLSFIGITGTNGKSTTCALIYHILKKEKRDVYLGGNFGSPILGLNAFQKNRIYVAEISSFQIETTPNLKPNVAVHLNIANSHLDRHKNLLRYSKIKSKIFSKQEKNDLSIVVANDKYSKKIFKKILKTNNTVVIANKKIFHTGYFYNKKEIIQIKKNKILKKISISKIRGVDNLENFIVAMVVSAHLGISDKKIFSALDSFKSLKHRLEFFKKYKNISFINDSKATNIHATSRALASFNNIFWIVGGKSQNENIAKLNPYFKKVLRAYLIGETKKEFEQKINNGCRCIKTNDLNSAVKLAIKDSLKFRDGNCCILLSPACPSYDQFQNFEERGDCFKKYIKNHLSQI